MPRALIEAEQGAIEHMNEDHREAMNLYATKLLGAESADWRCTGMRPGGSRYAGGAATLRLEMELMRCTRIIPISPSRREISS